MQPKSLRRVLLTDRYAPNITRNCLDLPGYMLVDAESDISVAARDLGIAGDSFVRLRRAPDRVECAQRLLVAMRGPAAKGETEAEEAQAQDGVAAAMREVVELLAREWPEGLLSRAILRDGSFWFLQTRLPARLTSMRRRKP